MVLEFTEHHCKLVSLAMVQARQAVLSYCSALGAQSVSLAYSSSTDAGEFPKTLCIELGVVLNSPKHCALSREWCRSHVPKTLCIEQGVVLRSCRLPSGRFNMLLFSCSPDDSRGRLIKSADRKRGSYNYEQSTSTSKKPRNCSEIENYCSQSVSGYRVSPEPEALC